MNNVHFILIYVVSVIFLIYNNISKGYCKMQYFRFEHPNIVYFDTEFLGNLSVKSRRISRSDPVHYVNISFYLRSPVTNEQTHSFYFYQLLSNTYRRSFVELHFYGCDLFNKKNMFSNFLLPAYYRLPVSERPYPTFKCPMKPGYYRFELLTIKAENVPENFPFTEGRMYYNLTKGNKLLVKTIPVYTVHLIENSFICVNYKS